VTASAVGRCSSSGCWHLPWHRRAALRPLSIDWLVFARALQGAASAVLVPVAMTLLGSAVTPLQRPRAMGVFSSLTGLAVLSGPLIGGLLVDSLAGAGCFGSTSRSASQPHFFARLRIPSNDRLVSKIDWPGVILLTIAMTAIVWGLSEGNAAGWSSAAIVSALTIGAGAAIAFFVWETKSLDALVPGRLMQSIQFRAGNLVCLLMFMSMMGTLIFMAQYFAITQQTSASGAGWRMMPWTVSLFVVAPIGGILGRPFRRAAAGRAGLLLQSAALTWMSFLCSSASSYGAWVPPLMLAGVGISLAMPRVQSAVLGSVAPRDMGKASGIYNTMRQLGWACGAAAAVAVFSGSGSLATAQTLRTATPRYCC